MSLAVHRLSQGARVQGVRPSVLPSYKSWAGWQKGWRNLACRESLPHKEKALMKPSWGREAL